jgi:hypothetical protein
LSSVEPTGQLLGTQQLIPVETPATAQVDDGLLPPIHSAQVYTALHSKRCSGHAAPKGHDEHEDDKDLQMHVTSLIDLLIIVIWDFYEEAFFAWF